MAHLTGMRMVAVVAAVATEATVTMSLTVTMVTTRLTASMVTWLMVTMEAPITDLDMHKDTDLDTMDKPTTDQVITDQVTMDQVIMDQVITDPATMDQVITDQVITDQPIMDPATMVVLDLVILDLAPVILVLDLATLVATLANLPHWPVHIKLFPRTAAIPTWIRSHHMGSHPQACLVVSCLLIYAAWS